MTQASVGERVREMEDTGLYDSADGSNVVAEKRVDVSKYAGGKPSELWFMTVKRGRIVQLRSGCAQIHYFMDEMRGRRMMNEDSERFGFRPRQLLALALKHAPRRTSAAHNSTNTEKE